ncbi:YbhB/YbcL family Raf kinase inhibitor-like protein [Microvirga sp. 2MCAF38]|uniref:YbhB/YbcL family Raf kinase inhibitor-like protein n=1 Tax=Microvirga sp. 2MCAF38 TaxID=3232989 RepID=UPI003F9AB668
MRLTSTAFPESASIPPRHACDGEDLSPPLVWTDIPSNTASLLLTCEDPDAPRGTFCHWVAFNIAPNISQLAEGAGNHGGSDILQAINDFGRTGYGGPCPPRGDKPHRYRFKISALDQRLSDSLSSSKGAQVIAKAQSHVIASAELIGHYGRGR